MMTEEETLALWERSQARYKRDFTAIDYIGMIEYVDYVNAELTNTTRWVSCSDQPLTKEQMKELFREKLQALHANVDKDLEKYMQTAHQMFFDIEFKD